MITTFSALAEPNRFHIVELLRDNPRSVNEIVSQLHLSQPLVSKHLRVLSQAGLVKAHPSAQQHIYALETGPFKDLDTWMDSFRSLWNDRLDVLDNYMQELKKSEKQDPQDEESQE